MLDPQVSPEEIKSREVELGLKVGLSPPLPPLRKKGEREKVSILTHQHSVTLFFIFFLLHLGKNTHKTTTTTVI